jgi:hypothetical protein
MLRIFTNRPSRASCATVKLSDLFKHLCRDCVIRKTPGAIEYGVNDINNGTEITAQTVANIAKMVTDFPIDQMRSDHRHSAAVRQQQLCHAASGVARCPAELIHHHERAADRSVGHLRQRFRRPVGGGPHVQRVM